MHKRFIKFIVLPAVLALLFLFKAPIAIVPQAHADTTIDFGTVAADAGSSSQTISLTNDSGDGSEWTITDVEDPSNPAFTIDNNECSDTSTVEDRETCTVTVDFDPSNLSGPVTATMDISWTSDNQSGNTGDGDTGTYDLTANVTAGGAQGGNQESSVAFKPNPVALNAVATAEVLFNNTSSDGSDWTITNITDPSQSNGDFTIGDQNCDTDTVVSSGDSCYIDLDFQSASDTGQQQSTMVISYSTSNGQSGANTYDLVETVGGAGTSANPGAKSGNTPTTPSKSSNSTTPVANSGTSPSNISSGSTVANPITISSTPTAQPDNGLVPCGGGEMPAALALLNGTGSTANYQANSCQFPQLLQMIARITNILVGFAGVYAIFSIVLAGVTLVSAAGNTEILTTGKNRLTNSIIGFVLVMIAYIAVNTIFELLNVHLTGQAGGFLYNPFIGK